MTRNSDLKALTLVPMLAFVLTPSGMAQNAAANAGGNAANPYTSSDTDKSAFDKHDLSGLWSRNSQQFKLPPCPECVGLGGAAV